MAKIQTVQDIFDLWSTISEMATAISERADTVRKWKKFSRIPQGAWRSVIDAALLKGVMLTVDDIMKINTPMKPQGRPAHKPKTHKRSEARVVG